MQEEEEEQNDYGNIVSNNTTRKKYNDFNVMRIRLEVKEFHQENEQMLRGYYITTVDDGSGMPKLKKIVFGKSIMNESGIQDIMKKIRMRVNPQTVQGIFFSKNRESIEFKSFIANFQEKLGIHLSINQYRYDLKDEDYIGLIEDIVDSVERFLSRSIDNLERESYGETIRSTENNTINQQTKGFGLFKS